MAIEPAKDPIDSGNPNRDSRTRASRIFSDARPGEVRLPNASAQRQPRRRGELVLYEECLRVTRHDLPIRERQVGPVIEEHAEELIIVLPKAVETRFDAVPGHGDADGRLRANVVRGPMIGDGIGKIVGRAIVIRSIEMIEGRDCEQPGVA